MWFSTVSTWLTGAGKSTLRSRRPKRACRPCLELLEDRAVPTLFNIAAGDVPGLIAALDTANTNGQVDVINLAPGAPYTLTTPRPSPQDGSAGLNVLADPSCGEGRGVVRV
jgi:hypothetical protein